MSTGDIGASKSLVALAPPPRRMKMVVGSPLVVTSALFGAGEPECKSDARPCRHPGLLP